MLRKLYADKKNPFINYVEFKNIDQSRNVSVGFNIFTHVFSYKTNYIDDTYIYFVFM